ncbi:MAG: translation initiation factor IF-2 [Zetaproteobacteria bacterium CG2_30_46_52]|nr:MAG: translation initiation factor IF-2 [Zetaproteobacteria bacterium CG2_30_46_52]
MANKRVLDLAKDLGVTADDVQRAAQDVGVAASGPASNLDQDDVAKITASIHAKGGKKPAGSTTLTLGKPRSTSAGLSRGESGSHSVEVSVRRRRSRPATTIVGASPDVTAAPKPTIKPAEQAQIAVQQAAEQKAADQKAAALKAAAQKAAAHKETEQKAAEVSTRPLPTRPLPTRPTVSRTTVAAKEAPVAEVSHKPLPKPTLSPAQMAAEKMVALKERKSEEQAALREKRRAPRPQRTLSRPADAHATPNAGAAATTGNDNDRLPTRAPRSQAPQGQSRPQHPGAAAKAGGPRTTIRTGLTPAQIAARKAPRSSMKQIEERISTDKRQQRQVRPAQSRPAGGAARPNTTGAGAPMPRRTPSVAVAPLDPAEMAAAQKKRGPQPVRAQKRRLTPAEKAARRDYSSKRHQSLTPEQEERMARLAKGGSRSRHMGITKDDEAFVIREVEIPNSIVVTDLAARMAVKSADLVKKLFEMGQMISVNEALDAETAQLIVEEFGHKPKLINEAAVEDALIAEVEVDEEALVPRPPVVVVMGHVDHGKTSILDALRKASVAHGEAGGITQHIGAYMVKLESNQRVVFVDTPGHEAFTGLRARGANLTDVAVLVVAADDGVMPQTVEALNHARAAGVPIIVAVNKMDKVGADPDKVKRQLSELDLLAEDWGGDTIFVNVSAHTGLGLDELLEMLALQTEILELKANPKRPGRGVVIESRLDKGRGPVATVLVQNGTFKQGDAVVVGTAMGRIRAIVDENQKQHKTAGPSIPFELIGLSSVPEAGLEIVAVENERQAKDIVSYRKEKERQHGVTSDKRASLDDLFTNMQSGVAEVPVLIKGDVTGSVDAMAESLAALGTDDVKVKLIHKGIGGITESDIMLASAAKAIVIGFNVRPEAKAKKLAEQEGVDVRFYKIIYEALDEIRLAMAGKLAPNEVEKVTGTAEIREVFQTPKAGAVAGSYITDGYVRRGSRVRVLRQGTLLHDGALDSLRRFKDDVKEVKNGYECGIGLEKFNDMQPGDTFEFYIIEEVAATL